jgi:hypothetical protein
MKIPKRIPEIITRTPAVNQKGWSRITRTDLTQPMKTLYLLDLECILN